MWIQCCETRFGVVVASSIQNIAIEQIPRMYLLFGDQL